MFCAFHGKLWSTITHLKDLWDPPMKNIVFQNCLSRQLVFIPSNKYSYNSFGEILYYWISTCPVQPFSVSQVIWTHHMVGKIFKGPLLLATVPGSAPIHITLTSLLFKESIKRMKNNSGLLYNSLQKCFFNFILIKNLPIYHGFIMQYNFKNRPLYHNLCIIFFLFPTTVLVLSLDQIHCMCPSFYFLSFFYLSIFLTLCQSTYVSYI